jgi:phospholipase C
MPAVRLQRILLSFVSWLAVASNVAAASAFAADPVSSQDVRTTTPVEHVIVIYGENRSFDRLFATYRPVSGNKVLNQLSKGIVNADGTPGPTCKKGSVSSRAAL